MRDPAETELVEYEGWIMRVARSTAARPRVLVLLHGWTGDENSMWVFVRNFPSDYWVIAPRARLATSPSGYTWRMAEATDREPPALKDLLPSAQALTELLDGYRSGQALPGDPMDVLGFSQGAGLAVALAVRYPDRIGRVGILSGFVPKGSESLLRARPLVGKHFFAAHGTLDEQVPFAEARRSVALLESAGAEVAFCEDDVRHKVSVGCLGKLEAFFA